MFFGSGNLVFPIAVGMESESHYLMASLGILCTCVIFPFLGMFAMMLCEGSVNEFFACFGRKGALILSFLALALMGPFGVLARCLTVIHGAMVLILPSATLTVTSFATCCLIYVIAMNRNRVVKIIGLYLTPFLLLFLAAIVFFGITGAEMPESIATGALGAFQNGFFQGYQTMDLLASIFFSSFVIQQLRRSNGDSSLSLFFRSSLLGAGLLYMVYFALIFLGWLYFPFLKDIPPQEMLGQVAYLSLGSWAGPWFCLLVIFACLTTSVALASLFADFLKSEVAGDKIGSRPALLATIGLAFAVSTLEFAGIANFLGPIVELIYPALIVLTVINIACKLCGVRVTYWPFTLALTAKLLVP